MRSLFPFTDTRPIDLMGKQFISTQIIRGHKSDVYDVAVCSKFTVSVSGDGHIKTWSHKGEEEPVNDILVDSLGLHHVDFWENDGILIIGTVAFSGILYLFQYIDNELVPLNCELKKNNWALKFHVGVEDQKHRLLTTQHNGSAEVYELTVEEGKFSLQHEKTLEDLNRTFALSIDVSSTEDSKIAIGYMNGTVSLYDFRTLRSSYTFTSTAIKSESSAVRCVKFSPGGTLLAVASDSESYGTISLYDVKFGEMAGSLIAPTNSNHAIGAGFAHERWCFSLDFNQDGSFLASGGMDQKVRIWDVTTREVEATITMALTDLPDDKLTDDLNSNSNIGCLSLKYFGKGIRQIDGDDRNEGLVLVGLDQSVRWYREAGGV